MRGRVAGEVSLLCTGRVGVPRPRVGVGLLPMLGTQKQSLAAVVTTTAWSAHPGCCSYSSRAVFRHPVAMSKAMPSGCSFSRDMDSLGVAANSGTSPKLVPGAGVPVAHPKIHYC